MPISFHDFYLKWAMFFLRRKSKYPMRHENDMIGRNVTTVMDGDGTVWACPVKEHPWVFRCNQSIVTGKLPDGRVKMDFSRATGIHFENLKTYTYGR